jgi:hypothetical protein
MEQITISGKTFEAPVRYEEGHELSAGEASALNQTYHENLRNNFAKLVKDAIDKNEFDQAALQTKFDAYAADYQFGVRVGGVSRDPVMSEAMNIAKNQIRAALKKKGVKLAQVDASAITDAAKKLLASPRGEPIMTLAKQRVEEAQLAAAEDLSDLVSNLPQKAAKAPAAEAA